MSTHKRIGVATGSREELVDITERIADVVRDAGARDGIVMISTPHTTAAVTINENADPAVQTDFVAWMRELVPRDGSFRHAEGNSDAHIKSSLVGFSSLVPLVEGRMLLGTWQGIYLCEFDGPRRRSVDIVVQ